MNDNFVTELPENYREVKVIDAKKRSTAVIFSILSLLPFIISLPLLWLYASSVGLGYSDGLHIGVLITCLAYFVYIILHELTHGLVYKIMTHRKLTFGLTLTVAFCGVPDIYVTRKTMMWSVIMPCAVYSAVCGLLMVIGALAYPVLFVCAAAFFSIHLGGCVGDLYVFGLTLFKYRDSRLLLRDTGPTQYFYLPE